MKEKHLSKLTQTRDINLDFIRVLSMIFVIAVHVEPKPLAGNILFTSILYTILFTCNTNFYLLSGQLHLRRNFSTPSDYITYYVQKMITILFPYITITFILSIWSKISDGNAITLKSFATETYKALMSGNASGHLWFMYPLIGLLLSAPFFSKLFQKMTDWELNLLFILALFWNTVSIYFTKNFNVGFSYSGWLLSSWSIYFFAGYYCSRIIDTDTNNEKKLYLFGIIGFIVTILGKVFLPNNYNYSNDLAVAFVVFAMATYTFLKKHIHIKNTLIQNIIFFVAKHSFTVYMLHYHVVKKIVPKIITTTSTTLRFFETIIATLLISLILAIILDKCFINPIQKILKKLFEKSVLRNNATHFFIPISYLYTQSAIHPQVFLPVLYILL